MPRAKGVPLGLLALGEPGFVRWSNPGRKTKSEGLMKDDRIPRSMKFEVQRNKNKYNQIYNGDAFSGI